MFHEICIYFGLMIWKGSQKPYIYNFQKWRFCDLSLDEIFVIVNIDFQIMFPFLMDLILWILYSSESGRKTSRLPFLWFYSFSFDCIADERWDVSPLPLGFRRSRFYKFHPSRHSAFPLTILDNLLDRVKLWFAGGWQKLAGAQRTQKNAFQFFQFFRARSC